MRQVCVRIRGDDHGSRGRRALRLDAEFVDYLLIALYFVFVLGIGVVARRAVSTSLDFFLSGRALPAWVTGLAFISANLGAVEIIGMSANGANYGIPTVHYFWIGAVPAMLFLGVVMMPFYYGSKVRSVPEFMRRRFGTEAHLVNALSFAVAQLLIAGINLYLLASIVESCWAGRSGSRCSSRRPSCSATPPWAGCRPRSTTRCSSSS